jgi:hypothetical protein
VQSFAEIADVLWQQQANLEIRKLWFDRILRDSKRLRSLELACSLEFDLENSQLFQWLLASSAVDPDACLLATKLVAQRSAGGLGVADKLASLLLQHYYSAADEPPTKKVGLLGKFEKAREGRDGPGWRYVVALLSLQLSMRARELRDNFISNLEGEKRIVASVLASAADLRGGDQWNDEHESNMRQLLSLPVPARPGPTSIRGVLSFSSVPRLTGKSQAFLEVARHLLPRDQGVAEALAEISGHISTDTAMQLEALLRDNGHPAAYKWIADSLAGVAEIVRGIEEGNRLLLEGLASACGHVELTWYQKWYLHELSELDHLLQLVCPHVSALALAMRGNPEVMIRLCLIGASLLGLEHAVIGSQAAYLKDLCRDSFMDYVLLHVEGSAPRATTKVEASLNAEDTAFCLQAVHSPHAHIVALSLLLLRTSCDPEGVAAQLSGALWDLHPIFRPDAVDIVIELSPTPAIEIARFLASGDALVIAEAASNLTVLLDEEPSEKQLEHIALLASHPDETVRYAVNEESLSSNSDWLVALAQAKSKATEPSGWTCIHCGLFNSTDMDGCLGCSNSRPGFRRGRETSMLD